MTIDPNIMTIDPNIMMIDLKIMKIDLQIVLLYEANLKIEFEFEKNRDYKMVILKLVS